MSCGYVGAIALESTLEDRFWANVKKTGSCWLWMGGLSAAGYGSISERENSYYAHRLSYEWHKGSIPEEMHIHHLCGVRRCINPDHLVLVTRKDHNYKLYCKNGHSLEGENLIIHNHKDRYS